VAKLREDLGRKIWGKYEGPITIRYGEAARADMTFVVHWIKRTRGKRSEHHKDSISEFRRSGNSKERGSNSQYANSRKDLSRHIKV
jgi:hypothetical protein